MRVVPLSAPVRSQAWATVYFLACLLLLAQTLGLIHGVVHGHQTPARGDGLLQETVQKPVAAAVADSGAAPLSSLFSSHDSDADCRLYDQASHGSAMPGIFSLILPMVLASRVFDLTRGEAIARWAALFDARGPPLTR